MLQDADGFSVALFRDILDAVHVDATVYSNVYDLTQRIVYLYYLGDYEHVVVLDLEGELAQGARTLDLPALFPDNEAALAWREPIVQRLEETRAARPTVGVDPQRYPAYVGEYRVPAELGSSSTNWAIETLGQGGERLVLKIIADKGCSANHCSHSTSDRAGSNQAERPLAVVGPPRSGPGRSGRVAGRAQASLMGSVAQGCSSVYSNQSKSAMVSLGWPLLLAYMPT
jgi:hypothetical protein